MIYKIVFLDLFHPLGIDRHPSPNVPALEERRGRDHYDALPILTGNVSFLLPPQLDLSDDL